MAKKSMSKSKGMTKKSTGKKPSIMKAQSGKTAAPKPTRVDKTRVATRPRNSSTMSYTYSEFLENVKGFCGLLRRSEAKELCDDIANFIRDSLKRGYKIPLLGLGKLYVRESKARMGRNPQTGEVVQIPARKRVRFSAAKALKETVL